MCENIFAERRNIERKKRKQEKERERQIYIYIDREGETGNRQNLQARIQHTYPAGIS